MQPSNVNLGGPPGELWTPQRTLFRDSHMTAIGVVGTEEGFAIGADGRSTLDDESKRATSADVLAMESEEKQKIFSVVDDGKILAYAVTGFVTLGKFVLMDEIHKKMAWLSKREFSTCKKYLVSVAEKVTEEINDARRAKLIEEFPVSRKTETGIGWKIADVIVVGYYRGIPSLTCAQFTHTQGTQADCDVNSYPPNYSILSGSDAVRKAMYPDPGGIVDGRFAEYRKKTPIRSLSDGEQYIKGYVAACSSDLGRQLDPEHWRITGGHFHLARITPKAGFDWVIPPISIGKKPTMREKF
jgi:hypothetical protein